MSETKYGKNIITEIKTKEEAPWAPKFKPDELIPMLHLDSSVINDAFYVETAWTLPAFANETHGEPHKHDYDEVLAFVGTNPDDPYDLGGEVELWIDGEQNISDRSFIAFIPAGTEHCPLNIRRVDRPIFHFTAGPGKMYF